MLISGAVGPGDHDRGETSIYLVSVLGGAVRKLRGGGLLANLSPDDKLLVFMVPDSGGLSLWLSDADGESPRPFLEGGGEESFTSPGWSSDGKRIVYRHSSRDGRTAAIESRGLDDAASVVLVRESNAAAPPNANDFLLLDGRLVYARDEPAPRNHDRNLWVLDLDPGTGRPRGEPKRLTQWVGLAIHGLSATADGSRLVFRSDRRHSDVWVGELGDGGGTLDRVRRLSLDDRDNSASYCWMPDAAAIAFDSGRNGGRDLLVQDLERRNVADLVVGPAVQSGPTPTPDGAFVLFWETDQEDPAFDDRRQLFRVPAEGGPKELVLETRWPVTVRCATVPEGPCFLGERRPAEDSVVWSRLDPVAGREEEAWREERQARLPVPLEFPLVAVSPDGSRMAEASDGNILVREIASSRVREIQVEEFLWPTGLAWAPDGSGFYVSATSPSGSTLLHVDLQGEAEVLYGVRDFVGLTAPSPSRDGRHLAFEKATRESNIWLVEEFSAPADRTD